MQLSIKLISLFSIALSLVFISSCGNTKELDASTSWSLSLNKSGCMDVCDSYEILIQNTGSYTYNGIYNVKHIGQKSGEIPENKLQQVVALTEKIDWSNSDVQYGSSGPGAQHKIVIYTNGLERFTIEYYRLEPQEIRALEQLIDQIIDNDEL